MRSQSNTLLNKGFDALIEVHVRISTWVAKLIGPTVFNYGTNQKGWNLSTKELLGFPDDSLGRALGKFLEKHKLEPLAGAEYHDVQHVLLDYSISFTDEVALQFFLHGNGKKSIASVSTMIGAWCILPHQWSYLRSAYKRGKNCRDMAAINLKALLHQNLGQAKRLLLKDDYSLTFNII